MKRRELLASIVTTGLATPVLAAQEHDHRPIEGPLASATVSFGFWPPADPARPNSGNRFAVPNAPAAPNGHALLPFEAVVKVGGAVNFIVAGFHLITVYKPGTTPEMVDVTKLVAGSVPPGLIDDDTNRVYFGVDPRTVPQDRVEVVGFNQPGRHLVICGVRPHFVNDHMYGWVRVVG